MRKEKRETFSNQRPLQEENRNQAKNTEEKKNVAGIFSH